ncbi:HAD family hydrolase [Paenibacillus piscarius]|uniref:HAD family hydrolase n=1 Tax=Paenibacillus piscarius TaxID=1089681 RepID=UPI001EE8DB7A|nr:HAD family hydrolase [Paenibacillus piscarius]
MQSFKIISLDMFQTLVNIQGRRAEVWKPLLKQEFSEARSLELGSQLLKGYYTAASAAREAGTFISSREIYYIGFQSILQKYGLDYDSTQAVENLFAQHRLSEMYADTLAFLERICEEYQVCIVSDTDELMLPDFYKNYPITLFTSEAYQSYKNDSRNRMFTEVIAHYGVEPGQILHIGDSAADVLGAARAGIRSCWLNREGHHWDHEIKPDYTAETLDEVYELLSAASSPGFINQS